MRRRATLLDPPYYKHVNWKITKEADLEETKIELFDPDRPFQEEPLVILRFKGTALNMMESKVASWNYIIDDGKKEAKNK